MVIRNIQNILLQILEDGQLTDAMGRKADFRNTIVLLSANLGARFLAGQSTPLGFAAGIQPDKIADPQRQALLARVKVHEAAEFTKEYPAHWSCRMQLTTRDGKKYTYTVPDASGSVAAPLTKAQLRSKAMNCCAELPEARLLPLFDALENLEKAQVLPETALR